MTFIDIMFATICYIKVQLVCSIKEHKLEHFVFLNKYAVWYTTGEPSNCKPVSSTGSCFLSGFWL